MHPSIHPFNHCPFNPLNFLAKAGVPCTSACHRGRSCTNNGQEQAQSSTQAGPPSAADLLGYHGDLHDDEEKKVENGEAGINALPKTQQ